MYQAWNSAGNEYFPNQFNRSFDSGQTWGSLAPIPGTPVFGTCAVGPNGDVYVVDGTGAVTVSISPTARNPAASPTFALRNIPGLTSFGTGGTPNPAGLIGQAQVLVDASNTPRRGCIYVVVTSAGTNGTDVVFRRSCDGGLTWASEVRFAGEVPNAANSWQWFGTMGLAPNGRLDLFYNDTSAQNAANLSRLYYTSSADGGATWSAPTPVGPVYNSHLGWPNQQKMGDYYDIESYNLGATLAYAATYSGGQDVYFLRVGAEDCDRNDVNDTAQLAANPNLDCDANGLLDSCEIAAGRTLDQNNNGVPDACERVCDTLDFNRDGVFPDSGDIDAFLLVFGGGACPTTECGDLDFNNDGVAPDSGDIEAFLRVFGGGAC